MGATAAKDVHWVVGCRLLLVSCQRMQAGCGWVTGRGAGGLHNASSGLGEGLEAQSKRAEVETRPRNTGISKKTDSKAQGSGLSSEVDAGQ